MFSILSRFDSVTVMGFCVAVRTKVENDEVRFIPANAVKGETFPRYGENELFRVL